MMLIIGACSPASGNTESARNRIVYGLTLQPSGFDPHVHASSELGIPLRMVYDTLVYRDPATQAFIPGLAESWSISADGLMYSFTLRQGVKFHDGTDFNAQAVGANIERILAPQTASQRASFMLGDFVRYEVVDDYNINLILGTPYSPLLDSLSQVYLGMASPAALTEFSNERYQFHQVGTGPYKFVEYVPGDRLLLQLNRDYTWGPSIYQPIGDNTPDEIEFRFFTDPAARSAALESGDVQVIGELLPTDARALTANSEIQLIPENIPGQPLQFLINTARFPTDDVRVRQALIFGANREAIVDSVFQRFSAIAWAPLAAGTAFYSRDLVGAYAYDVSRAQELLTQAGYTDTNNNGYVDFSGVDLEIRVIVPPWGLIPEVSQLLQDQWRTIGVRAVLEGVPSRNLLVEEVDSGEYNLVAFYEFGVDPAFLTRYFSSEGVNNWTGFADPNLDALLRDAEQTQDESARSSLYGQVQQIVMEQALILPIRDYVNLNGVSRGLQNLTYDVYGWFPLLVNTTVSGELEG